MDRHRVRLDGDDAVARDVLARHSLDGQHRTVEPGDREVSLAVRRAARRADGRPGQFLAQLGVFDIGERAPDFSA